MEISERLMDRRAVLEVDDHSEERLVESPDDTRYGARPLNRLISKRY